MKPTSGQLTVVILRMLLKRVKHIVKISENQWMKTSDAETFDLSFLICNLSP